MAVTGNRAWTALDAEIAMEFVEAISSSGQTRCEIFRQAAIGSACTGGAHMRLERRLRALEERYLSDPVILYFADGSTKQITGPKDFLLTLLVGACRGNLAPEQAEMVRLIRDSISAREPGGARMTELLRISAGPADVPDENEATE